MSGSVNLINPVFAGIPSSNKGEEESHQALIDLTLSDDALSLIFNCATQGCQDVKTGRAILEVNRRWRNVFETYNLAASWGKLQKEAKSSALRDLVGRMAFVDRFVSRVIASAMCSYHAELTGLEFKESKKERLLTRIESMGSSSFSRFSYLTRELRKQGAPIPDTHAVIGLERSPYESKQQRLDTALERIWQRIQQKIDFEEAPIPASAQAVRQWLSDPINTDKIAGIRGLILSDMNLAVLPSEIGVFFRLKEFLLPENEFTSLPSTLGNLSLLTKLNLSANQLRSLPSTIANLSQLKRLDLSRNHLISLPAAIGCLSQLISLDLTKNQLSSLPAAIGNLSRLEELCLAKNQLTSVPWTIGNLSLLRELCLAENGLKSLPDAIGSLSRLINLGLESNQLTSLPPTIGNLSRLRRLSLSYNQLTSLPSTIGQLSRLEDLFLNANLCIFDSDRYFWGLGTDQAFSVRYVANKLLACSGYACRTPLASLCQAIHRAEGDEVLKSRFQQLSDEMQRRICKVWTIFSIASSSSFEEEEQEDLFANRSSFVKAVMTATQDKWISFSGSQCNQIFAQVAILAGQPNGDVDWGKAHAKDNMIRLIDAMELIHKNQSC